MLILCFSFAAWAQKGNSYLEKPLPQGWGTGTAHTIPGDEHGTVAVSHVGELEELLVRLHRAESLPPVT